MKYERAVYNTTHFVSEARNKSLINTTIYDSGTGAFTDPTAFGAEIEVTNTELKLSLFEDTNQNCDPSNIALCLYESANDTILNTFSEKNVLRIESISGSPSHGSALLVKPIVKINIMFLPDPHQLSFIQVFDEDGLSSIYRSIDIIFYQPNPYTEGKTNRKKYSFESVSQISQMNEYPIFTTSAIIDATTLNLFSNAEIVSSDTSNAEFSILQGATTINVTNIAFSQKTVTLTLDAAIDLTGDDVKIIYSRANNEFMTADGIPLKSHVLNIPLSL